MKLRDGLLLHASEERRNEIEEAMQSISPIISARNGKEDSDSPQPAIKDASPDDSRDESEWWKEIEEFLKKQKEEDRNWGYSSGLMSIARRRAQLHGNDELLPGLNIQLNMHIRWAFGGEELDAISMPELSDSEYESPDDVFIQLIKILLNTFSVEVAVAALEGLHIFVAQNPAIISRLFNDLSEEWPRRWLLSAAESWAVLHPDHYSDANATIVNLMETGDLVSRLQAWIVLTRNAQTLGADPPTFPLPDEPERSIEDIENIDMSLLAIPPTDQGSTRFANKFSSVHMLVEYCQHFDFRFEILEGLIAQELISEADSGDIDLRKRGPHRHADFTYVPAEAEKAFGNVVSSILSSDWCDNAQVAKLSQAILSNEDSWIHRTRPRAIRSFEDWAPESEYGGDKADPATRRQRMLDAARSASVDDHWMVFVARIRDFTWKADFDLHFWFEETEDSLLVSAPRAPTCPGGRSFIWWIGEPLDLGMNRFVSGLFVGGHQRLSHCHFEIRPPLAWRDEFGWSPNPLNPLEWLRDGELVAKYERIHGVLRDVPHGPKYRQPFIDRWLVTSCAFDAVKEKYSNLRERDTFEVYQFKE